MMFPSNPSDNDFYQTAIGVSYIYRSDLRAWIPSGLRKAPGYIGDLLYVRQSGGYEISPTLEPQIIYGFTNTDVNEPPPPLCPTPIATSVSLEGSRTASTFTPESVTVVPASPGSGTYTFSGDISIDFTALKIGDPIGEDYACTVQIIQELSGQTVLSSYPLQLTSTAAPSVNTSLSTSFSVVVAADASVEAYVSCAPSNVFSQSSLTATVQLSGLSVVCP
jgi:hypothetical protein